MKLYNVIPTQNNFQWKNDAGARHAVPMVGLWLGKPGRKCRHVFVPIVTGEEEPHPEEWGVTASRQSRPKLMANYDSRPGWLAVISSLGSGASEGRVWLDSDAGLRCVRVLEHGQGMGNSENIFRDALLEIRLPDATAEVIVKVADTNGRETYYLFREEAVIVLHTPEEIPPHEFIELPSNIVQTWSLNAP